MGSGIRCGGGGWCGYVYVHLYGYSILSIECTDKVGEISSNLIRQFKNIQNIIFSIYSE